MKPKRATSFTLLFFVISYIVFSTIVVTKIFNKKPSNNVITASIADVNLAPPKLFNETIKIVQDNNMPIAIEKLQQITVNLNIKSPLQMNTLLGEKNSQNAYITLIHGIDNTFKYRGFLYNALIMRKALLGLGSTADFIVMLGFTTLGNIFSNRGWHVFNVP